MLPSSTSEVYCWRVVKKKWSLLLCVEIILRLLAEKIVGLRLIHFLWMAGPMVMDLIARLIVSAGVDRFR